MLPPLSISASDLADICEQHHIRKLSLFGSMQRGDFHEESDVDLLVEFAPDKTVDLFDMVEIELKLGRLLQRPVDLRTLEELSHYFREEVLETAEVLYEQS